MDETPVICEARDAVLVITLNRPAVHNAIDLSLAVALQGALDAFQADPDLRVAVVHGAGPSFCAGADLGGPPVQRRAIRDALRFLRVSGTKPLVAAVHGNALGGGLELAIACDLIVCDEDARLGLPEVRRGIVATGGGLLRLPKLMAPAFAMAMALTGEPVTASELHRMGLVSRLAPSGRVLEVAMQLASAIARNAPLAVAAAKAIIAQSPGWRPDEAWARQEDCAGPVFASSDAKEGRAAFAEKREPVWSGR